MKSLAQARIKRDRALQLAAEGHSYDTIADAVGYSHRGSAHRAVFKALNDHEVENVNEYRAMEMARLDFMLSSLWPQIEQGSVEAITAALKISDLRCRVMGIYNPGRRTADEERCYLVRPPEGNPGVTTAAT